MAIKNFDDSVKINRKPNWPYIPAHLCILGFLLPLGWNEEKLMHYWTLHMKNLILTHFFGQRSIWIKVSVTHQQKRKKQGLNILKIQRHLLTIDKKTDYFHENLEDYNPTKEKKVLIVSDDMITVMERNKKLNPIVTELFIRRKNSTFLLF